MTTAYVDEHARCGSGGYGDHGPVLCLCGAVPHDQPVRGCQTYTPTYSALQMVHLTRASYRQVDYWARTGRLSPVVEATGSGTVRRFLGADLDLVRIVLALLRFGMTLDPAFHVAMQLVERDEYRVVLADVFELRIVVRDTASEATG